MVSRRRILSRSRDDLTMDGPSPAATTEDEEDVWYNKEKLIKDHIGEVLEKWTQIDDEIWAKVIVLERNRRVAKAYARAPVLTVNGSDEGFDGFRIGLCGFDNPMRDQKTEEIKRHIGHGVKVKMDEEGNILVKRVSKCNVYVRSPAANGHSDMATETSLGSDVARLPNGALEVDKPVKLFDMRKFEANVGRELRRAYPDRRRLEFQCVSVIAFVRPETNSLLDCPVWVLLINVLALDMLKARMPPTKRVLDIRNRPRIPIPDEDPYSVASVAGANKEQGGPQQMRNSRGERPPKLPPRDAGTYHPHEIPKPDYEGTEDAEEEEEVARDVDSGRPSPGETAEEAGGKFKQLFASSRTSAKQSKSKDKKYDDPYYCGLRARVPNFVQRKARDGERRYAAPPSAVAGPPHHHHQPHGPLPMPHPIHHHPHPPPHLLAHHPPGRESPYHGYPLPRHQGPPPHQQALWHARSIDSGMDSEVMDSPYNHIYGRLPIPTRAFIPQPQPRMLYVGEWD
ncbi:uncharacterized protein [Hetaerina americana]|uniref:uncharacterized protein isoform X2 n=1 Tax=Hetaerina americana TaxID=62018 RepID=UPI003A7F3B1D